MKSTIDLVRNLYDLFIESRDRTIAMGIVDEYSSQELAISEDCGTGKIVLSVYTDDIHTDDVYLYLDILELFKLGYDYIDTDIDFNLIKFSTFFFKLDNDRLSYFYRRLDKTFSRSYNMYVSLNDLLNISVSHRIVDTLKILYFSNNDIEYSLGKSISYRTVDNKEKYLNSNSYDIIVCLELSSGHFSDNKIYIGKL